MGIILEAKNITKNFSGVKALDEVNFQLEAGKVTALIGENGAGKSTLLKIMSGIHTEYQGTIHVNDRIVQFSSPREALDKGISIIHQELNLIPYLTIAQNIFLGRELTTKLGLLDRERMNQQTSVLLRQLKLDIAPTTMVSELKVGQQQIVEIAKTLLTESHIVFMDEPTSAIGEQEVELLFQIINQLKSEGKSVVYISHKLDELYAIADLYVVLRDGKLVGKGNMKNVSRKELINMMAGREIGQKKKVKIELKQEEVLKVENLNVFHAGNSGRKVLSDISFNLHKGEILGLYGLMGAGRTELLTSLFGLRSSSITGSILIEGKEQFFKSPKDAIKAGLALVPEDRKREGIIPEMTVAENMSLTVLGSILKWGMLNRKLETSLYQKYRSSLNIKSQSPSQKINTLSGGNQQKLVMAKWMERSPKILLLDEPSRGIDINAKNELYELITQLATSGISVIIASSEIPEILAVSHRILVLAEGSLTANFMAEEANESKIISACISQTKQK